jgi:hypothetical protein
MILLFIRFDIKNKNFIENNSFEIFEIKYIFHCLMLTQQNKSQSFYLKGKYFTIFPN